MDPEYISRQTGMAESKPQIVMANLLINVVDAGPVWERLATGEALVVDWLFVNGRSCPMNPGLQVTVTATAEFRGGRTDGPDHDEASAGRSGAIADLPTAHFFLKSDFDRQNLALLTARFRSVVKREVDSQLAAELEHDLLASVEPELRTGTIRRLAKWCQTDGIYADGMEVAKEISLLLFGQVLDRSRLGV
jgi:hypothetical protein